jgi:hypothetical protein
MPSDATVTLVACDATTTHAVRTIVIAAVTIARHAQCVLAGGTPAMAR